ncbi:MAG TPA: hypothetical protein VN673_05660 [Clostridia bacterium]|nr:hypothetical protein [Clostridia bacterium]
MSEMYVIHWVSKVNGRAGKGTKLFSREEAEQLVSELNEEYPQIKHEAVAATQKNQTTPTDQVVSVE